jgi:hypothetical protein
MRRFVRTLFSLAVCYQVGGCVISGSYSSGDFAATFDAGGGTLSGLGWMSGSGGTGRAPSVPNFGVPLAPSIGGSPASAGGTWGMAGGGGNDFSAISFQQNSLGLVTVGGGGP